MDKLEDAVRFANSLAVERPYYEPGLLLGTSAFNAAGWGGSFYPAGVEPGDFLGFFSSQFAAGQLGSTFFRSVSPRKFEPPRGCRNSFKINTNVARDPAAG